jgi:hypothetical protein
MSKQTTLVAFRLPDEMIANLDAYAARMAAERPGERVTRTDAARRLLTAGMAAEGATAYCGARKGDATCTMHRQHRGQHFDSLKDVTWK